ncbi:telomerase reverse transcriptase-like [Saccoglossus kowalevskii]|uniref:Telomerase reverse transcriptase n=1 Tax=Saccoglossus kowalevskii TaxID=10224 RepID=A0A7G6KMQ5_SACKO|nr:telomerase reverse transriptase (TERT) [Saccoglossus kowalevskii]
MQTLKCLYKKTATLKDYILLLDKDNKLLQPLVQESDNAEYKYFLQSTIVGWNENYKGEFTFEQFSYLKDIISRLDPFQCKKNSATNMKTDVWETLLERVGDDVITHLLKYPSMFTSTVGNSFIQISGADIHKLKSSVSSESNIDKMSMFYAKTTKEKLPKSFKLSEYNASISGALNLLSSIYTKEKLYKKTKNKKVQRMHPRFLELKKLMIRLLQKHRHCNYHILLNRYCPASKSKKSQNREIRCRILLSKYTRSHDVYCYIRAVVYKLIPRKLWGSNHNREAFLRNVRNFLNLGRYEKFSSKQLMYKIRISDIDWCKTSSSHVSPQESLEREFIVQKLLTWLLTHVIMVILKSMFYITESSVYRNHVFFYRKMVWKDLKRLGMKDYVERGVLRKLPNDIGEEKSLKFGFYNLRFLPKKSSVRPIITKSVIPQVKTKNFNLKAALETLKYVTKKSPELVGSAVFGMHDVYDIWKKFVNNARQKNYSELYFVKLDIEKCYDTMIQYRLMCILVDILNQEKDKTFIMRHYVICGTNQGRLFKNHKWNVTSTSDHQPDMVKFIQDMEPSTALSNKIIIEVSSYEIDGAKQLLQNLSCHISDNIVKINKSYYKQDTGVFQGSTLSNMLCNIYYGQMEKEYLHGLDKDGILVRMVDDFLLVTPSLEKAQQFLKIMSAGIPRYGCKINSQKTVTNFEVGDTYTATSLPSEAVFPWCGLLINTKTLEVNVDYEVYRGIDMADTFTMDLTKQPGKSLINKMKQTVSLKCHPIFMDGQVNSFSTLLTNLCRMWHFAACRFFCMCERLAAKNRIEDNPSFFMNVLLLLVKHSNKYCTICTITRTTNLWLCLKTFLPFLVARKASCMALLKLVKLNLKKQSKKIDVCTREKIEEIIQWANK